MSIIGSYVNFRIMKRFFTYAFVFCFVLACFAAFLTPQSAAFSLGISSVEASEWVPLKGDFVVVDVTDNIGYLVRKNLREGTAFLVATGQQRTVYYKDMFYYGATPEKEWFVESLEYQAKGPTFGKHGKFLRLYDDGESTYYGIHTVWDEKEMFSFTNRHRSWGCILVRDNILSLLEDVFEVSGDEGMRVITVSDISEFPVDLKRLSF